MFDLTAIFHSLQRQLFPALAEEIGALTALDRQFCEVISLTQLGRFTHQYEGCGEGRPPCSRTWLTHAFIAKHVYQLPTTGALIHALQSQPTLRRLCGWESAGEVPSEPTFSRAFAQFAADQLPQRIHENMVKVHAGPKLVGHISRDATALEAPERPASKLAAPPSAPRKRGRPKKGEERPAPPPSAYDAPQIHAFSRGLGHVPIIDHNPRGGEKRPFAPAQAERYKERSASERVNRLLKERYGGRWVRVRGAAKVMCPLMFGLVALTATALYARLC